MHREEEEEIEMDSDDSGKTYTLKLNLICWQREGRCGSGLKR
jgi:hypothetical protein